jgi:hypothetical protein
VHAQLPVAQHELELPAGISVDLVPMDGEELRAEQFEHAIFGRSVRFGVGTRYEIEVTNAGERTVSMTISIDGVQVQQPPMQVRSDPDRARVIRGFTESRTGYEVTDDEGRRLYETETTTSPFVATLPDAAGGASSDLTIGEIKFKFHPVKYVNCHPGSSHAREWGGSRAVPTGNGKRARNGVLQTTRGADRDVRSGRSGPTKDRKPVANTKTVLGGCTITICDRDR